MLKKPQYFEPWNLELCGLHNFRSFTSQCIYFSVLIFKSSQFGFIVGLVYIKIFAQIYITMLTWNARVLIITILRQIRSLEGVCANSHCEFANIGTWFSDGASSRDDRMGTTEHIRSVMNLMSSTTHWISNRTINLWRLNKWTYPTIVESLLDFEHLWNAVPLR